jgi:hypothetical protein
MKNYHYFEKKIKEILSRVEPLTSRNGDFDTCKVLYELASTLEWDEAEFKIVDFLSKRFDISKKLFSAYFSNGSKATNVEITDNAYLELVVAILLKSVLMRQTGFPVEVRLKSFNTLFKAWDIVQPEWLFPESALRVEIELVWQSLVTVLDDTSNDLKIASMFNIDASGSDKVCKVIPLTMLFYEGPISRAYLATLHSLGLKPKKIIEIVAAKDVATKKFVGKWLPRGLRLTYAASIQRRKLHYWPKQLLKANFDVVSGVFDKVQTKFGFKRTVIDNATALLPLVSYSDCVESILIEGLDDKCLQKYLSKEPSGTVLYTGGGIVPSTLLELKHIKFLHIHPGFLPDIRGADCALWSSLLKGRTSATCFYMSEGIDTGDVISSFWLPKLSFNVDIKGINSHSIYRIIYGFIDPWIRAFVLRDLVNNYDAFDALDVTHQTEEGGVTFYFMHQRLRDITFKKLFKGIEV